MKIASEKTSLVRFILLYSLSTLTLISIFALYFYSNHKKQILDDIKNEMRDYSIEFIGKLTEVHQRPNDTFYPQHKKYRTALYDNNHEFIFSDYKQNDIDWSKTSYQDGDKLILIKKVKPHLLGTAYLVIATKIDSLPFVELKKNMFIIMSIIISIILLLSYFLGRQFIKPMRQSIELLDNFIKDTTHELNTPVSIIMTNIEAASEIKKDAKLEKYMARLDIAARTISNLYDSLTFLKLNHPTEQHDETFNVSTLLQERIKYFELHFESRQISVKTDIAESIGIYASSENIRRLIDNLISNAIKYNRRGGKIFITLNKKFLSVEDNGIGIPLNKLDTVFERFTRIKNNSEGGFGIGLHIVKIITENYGYLLEIDSKEREGTMVTISW